jgi:hypothetical protein
MAKGQVTTDDLASGIRSFGGLAQLGGSSRPVRDNPFRDTRSDPVQPVVAAPPPTQPAVTTPAPAAEVPRLEVINGTEPATAGEGSVPASVPAAPRPARERKPAAPRPLDATKVIPQRVVSSKPSSGAEAAVREKKTELYTERVTVLLNADLRDRAEALAKELHRRRTQKGERITANTIFRVAIRGMLDTFDPATAAELNTELDLYEAVLRRWPKG